RFEPSNRVGDMGRQVPATGILLAGCQDSQLSWEQNGQGMFTNQLNRTFSAGTGVANYSSFMAAIKQQMPANQTPNFFPFGTPGNEFYLREPPFTA
ncbi:MAG: caspase family protein, partial [Betaproteobacteria bacterium]